MLYGNNKSRRSDIDQQEAFYLYLEHGTPDRALQHYAGKNPRTGKPFRKETLWYAAKVFMVENPEEAKQAINQDCEKRGRSPMTDLEWVNEIAKSAYTVFKIRSSKPTTIQKREEAREKTEQYILENYPTYYDEFSLSG